ncbi:MAG TPA: ScyD/ScyE family protein [Thermoleophilaceae bacterium]|jgi:glucose/arabinose dehydrogenase|nr:ScyD/ScyE family protein [Thermoleophilaceae bacterium]
MDSQRSSPLRRIALGTAALAAVSVALAPGAQAATVETVARGLDNPRSVAVTPDGSVYVANAGRAGRRCQGKGEERQCLGFTGRIVRVAGGKARTFAKGFASLGSPGGLFAGGLSGVSVNPSGEVFGVTGSGPPGFVKSLPRSVRRQTGRVFDIRKGGFSAVARIDRFEWRNNVDKVKGDRNSNPYAVLAQADREVVVDAGANAVFEVRGRKVSLLTVIPKNGKSQPVPTSIAAGANGDLYVGELAEGAGKSKARVWRIHAAGGAPSVAAGGFTNITGVAVGPDGSLFVTEFARNLRKEDIRGEVTRVAPDGTRTKLGQGKLFAPTGAAVDANGAVYVSNNSVLPGKTPKKSPFKGAGGTLVKITP